MLAHVLTEKEQEARKVRIAYIAEVDTVLRGFWLDFDRDLWHSADDREGAVPPKDETLPDSTECGATRMVDYTWCTNRGRITLRVTVEEVPMILLVLPDQTIIHFGAGATSWKLVLSAWLHSKPVRYAAH